MAGPVETCIWHFVVMFLKPLTIIATGLWALLGPVSMLQFVISGRDDLDPVWYGSVLWYVVRFWGITAILGATFFWLGLRRGRNATTVLLLAAGVAAPLVHLTIYAHTIRTTFPTPATFGTVLPIALCVVLALASLAFLLRHVSPAGPELAEGPPVKLDIFWLVFVVVAPLCVGAWGLWALSGPTSFLRFFFPAYAVTPASANTFDSPVAVLVTRLFGTAVLAAAWSDAVALHGADTRTTSQLLCAQGAAVAAGVVAYGDVFAVAPVASAGPVLLFVACGLYFAVALAFLYCFLFLGAKCDPPQAEAPLYAVGTPLETATI